MAWLILPFLYLSWQWCLDSHSLVTIEQTLRIQSIFQLYEENKTISKYCPEK